MENVVLVIHVLSAFALVALVLIQKSEGGALSGLGGGGNPSMGLFTARGTANVLTRATAVLAVVFMATALLLASFAKQNNSTNILQQIQIQQQQSETQDQSENQVPIGQ